MARSTSFSGASGAAWPALSNGDTWDAAITTTNIDATMYVSFPSLLTGSGGYISVLQEQPPVYTALAVTGIDTTTGAVSYLCPSVNIAAGSSTNNEVTLLILTSTHTVSHYHQIDAANSTGGWIGLVYTKVGDYEYNDGVTFTRISAWTAYGTPATVGRFRFRTRTGGANPAVGTVQSTTLAGTDTISTGASYSPIKITGCLLTTSGSDAIKYANNAMVSGVSGVTMALPAALSRYNNQMLVAFSYYANSATGAADGAVAITEGAYGTPSFGYENAKVTLGTTTGTRKISNTILYASTGGIKTGGLGLEVQSSNTTDTWPGGGVTAMRLAATTSYSSTEVRTLTSGATNTPTMPVIRHCTVAGTRWWISYGRRSSVRTSDKATVYWNTLYLSKGDGTVLALKDASWGTVDNSAALYNAVRVRNSAGGGLWISAKSWTTTEPDWPASEGSGDTTGTDWTVVNVVDNANAGSIAIATTTGRNGLVSVTSGQVWTSFADLEWSDAGAALIGTGTLSASATSIRIASAALSGVGNLSGTPLLVASASASVIGAGNLGASATSVIIASAALSGSSTLSAEAGLLLEATASLSGAGSLYASPILVGITGSALTGAGALAGSAQLIATSSATITGAGDLSATPSAPILIASAALSGSGSLSATPVIVQATSGVLSGEGNLSATPVVILLASASLSSQGSLSATATGITVSTGTAAISGQGSLAASAVVSLRVATAAISGQGTLTSAALIVPIHTATVSLAGQGEFVASAIAIMPTGAVLSGTGSLTSTVVLVTTFSVAITGNGVLTAAAILIIPDPLQVRETFTKKVGTGAASVGSVVSTATSSLKVGTGTTSVAPLVSVPTSSTKVGSGLTHTIIKEI